jgi:tRNA-binding EMAP/Myf-like protein
VWDHKDSEKLYCEKIDIGEESGLRQIGSGLRGKIEADTLK